MRYHFVPIRLKTGKCLHARGPLRNLMADFVIVIWYDYFGE